MKKILSASAMACALLTSGCYAGMAVPVPGFLYAEVKAPKEGIADASDVKTGRATCKSLLGLIALGDCSVEAAKKNGGLAKVQYVDVEALNILGVYATYTTVAKGQ